MESIELIIFVRRHLDSENVELEKHIIQLKKKIIRFVEKVVTSFLDSNSSN